MKQHLARFFVSLALILAGGLLLAQNLGYLRTDQPAQWALFFGGLSLLFFLTYFVNGLRSWWWLFPAFVLGSVGVTIWVGATGLEGSAIGTLFLASVALPFFAAFASNTRQNWWALIPATLLSALATIPLVENRIVGEGIAAMVLFALALPFLLIFLLDTTRRWALIPALVLGCVGIIPLVTVFANQSLIPVVIMGLFSAAFLAVFIVVRSAWWALIPAGVFASIGASVFTSIPRGLGDVGSMTAGVMFLGWAATFFILYLLRTDRPTAWAIYPAMACGGVAILMVFLSPPMRFVWPIALIALGGYILYRGLRKPKLSE